MRFFPITLSGCLKSCLDYWPWGRERESLNLISVATYFKTISSNFTEVVLVTLCSQLLLHIIKTGYDFCYPTDLLQSKFSKVDCHSFIMPQSGLPHPMISMKAHGPQHSPWICTHSSISLHNSTFL